MRIAVVQARPVSPTFDDLLDGGDVRHALDLLDRAATLGAELICFPELYPSTGEAELREAAARLGVYVIAGLLVDAPGGGRHNTATLIDPDGSIVGRQAKQLPTKFETDRGTVPSRGYEVFATPLGRIGMVICADLPWAPDAAPSIRDQGADVLFNPSWWFAIGAAYPATIVSRHLEFGLPVIGVNVAAHALASREDGQVFPTAGGYSTITIPPPVDDLDALGDWFRSKPGGTNSAEGFVRTLGEDEEVAIAEIDVEAVRRFPGYYYAEPAAHPRS